MADLPRIGIILASVREGRRGEAFARWIHRLAAARGDADVQLIDLKDWPIPPYVLKMTPVSGEAQYPAGSLEYRWAELVRSLDGFVIVTPEYNHGYTGQLKNAIDVLWPAWNHKPIGFVSYGGWAAGARAAEQLALVAIELRMVPIRDQVNIRLIGLAIDEAGAPTDELYAKRAATMLDELMWFARVLRDARAAKAAK
ncbi:MAG TPA: NAD(P)H-dependent oxidoreductase [Kofleriaceae bacterium]|nr:NAD(P)H-dependent oxidoreductase [Kofleriaceae bacterium]